MRVLPFFIFVFSLNELIAQNSSEEDLINEYFNLLKNHAYQRAIELSDNAEDSTVEIHLNDLAKVLYYAGQSDFQPRELKSKPGSINEILLNLTQGYFSLYNDPYNSNAFKEFTDAYEKAKNLGNRSVIKFCLLSILEVYYFELSLSNEDFEEYLNRYNTLVEDDADLFHYKMYVLLFNLRNVFYEVKIDQSFIDEFDNLMARFPENHDFKASFYSTKGVFYTSIGDLNQAHQYQQKAIETVSNAPYMKYIKFRANIHLAELMRRQNRFEEALAYIKVAEENKNMADTLRSAYYINYYLSQNFNGMGDYQKAYEHLFRAMDLKNQFEYQKNTAQIANLNVRFQTQEKELALMKEREKVKETRNMLLVAGFIILFLGTVYFLQQQNSKKKALLAVQENKMRQQKEAALLKEQELKTIDAMIEGQEKERQRIANQLHDDLGGLMATIKMHFEALQTTSKEDTNGLYKKTNGLISDAYTKIRAIAHAKNSGVIAKEGLLKSVKEMASKVSLSNRLSITVNDFGLDNRLENSLELSLFRIIQELITNVIKHAKATEVNIDFTNHGDQLNMVIEDNGQGFNPAQLTKSQTGMGLKSIDKRVQFLNGTMEIDSELGKGTTIIINIPL